MPMALIRAVGIFLFFRKLLNLLCLIFSIYGEPFIMVQYTEGIYRNSLLGGSSCFT